MTPERIDELRELAGSSADFVAVAPSELLWLLSRAEAFELIREALEDVIAAETEPCQFDHHGFCQEHVSQPPCVIAVARAALEESE